MGWMLGNSDGSTSHVQSDHPTPEQAAQAREENLSTVDQANSQIAKDHLNDKK